MQPYKGLSSSDIGRISPFPSREVEDFGRKA